MWKPDTEKIAEAVEKAPSIFNSQPWSLTRVAEDRIELYARLGELGEEKQFRWDLAPGEDDTRYPDPLARELVISCGAALFNLRLAVRVEGHDLAVRLPPHHPARDSMLLASVEIVTGRVKEPAKWEQELYEAIWRCPVNRWPYTILPAPLPIIVAMEGAAFQEGASLRVLHPRQARKWLHLAREADQFFAEEPENLSQIAHERYQRHQAYRDGLVGTPEGVPVETFGPAPENRLRPTRQDFWLPDQKARFEQPPHRDRGPFERPQLMVLSTDDDQVLDWLRAGQALQRAILTATRFSMSPPYGVAAKYHALYRYGVPGRHHLVRRYHREDLAYYGLSVSPLSQPLEQYDIEHEDTGYEDTWRRGSRRYPRPLPWRFAELPQLVIRVGYAVKKADAAPRRPVEIPDVPSQPPPGGERNEPTAAAIQPG
jgi:nitroreductase